MLNPPKTKSEDKASKKSDDQANKKPDDNITSGLENNEPNVWRILKWIIYLGFAAIIILCLGSVIFDTDADGKRKINFLFFLRSSGTGLLISGACFSAGALTGFLFAIPKLLQNTSLLPDNIQNNETVILHNDNLVQISDWLTKIIVGVGLTQLYNIPGFIKKIGLELGPSFGSLEIGRNIAIGTILYFAIVGFLAAYIWTRLYFVKLLRKTDDELRRQVTEAKQEVTVAKQETEAIKDQVSSEKSKESVEKNELASDISTIKLLKEKSSDELKGKLDLLKQKVKEELPNKPIVVEDDPQKNRWGGKAENNGKQIRATVVQLEASSFYNILITVFDKEKPLNEPVAIFVHDSFRFPDNVLYVNPDANGVAQVTLIAYEAFTIGALFADGTELELDLNDQPGYPEKFYWDKSSQSSSAA